MIRDVDLVSYLPPFMAEYQEIRGALEAENPEFVLVWKAADRVLSNEFIVTADEYGISRFEKILGIFPSREDTLESRRSRVQARWFNKTPYTWRVFIERLISLCGESDFTITTDFLHYRVNLEVSLELFGQIEELEHMIDTLIPCNMVFTSTNKVKYKIEGMAFAAGGIVSAQTFFISDSGNVSYTIKGDIFSGGGIVSVAKITITDSFAAANPGE